jgi:hypothetical protein
LIKGGEVFFGRVINKPMVAIAWWRGKKCRDHLNMVALGFITLNFLAGHLGFDQNSKKLSVERAQGSTWGALSRGMGDNLLSN